MNFFETTPSGDILSTTGKSMRIADIEYPLFVTGFIENLFEITAGLILSVIVTPYVLIAIFINGIMIYSLMDKYIRTTTQMRILDQN
jgi:hypothetical protein